MGTKNSGSNGQVYRGPGRNQSEFRSKMIHKSADEIIAQKTKVDIPGRNFGEKIPAKAHSDFNRNYLKLEYHKGASVNRYAELLQANRKLVEENAQLKLEIQSKDIIISQKDNS